MRAPRLGSRSRFWKTSQCSLSRRRAPPLAGDRQLEGLQPVPLNVVAEAFTANGLQHSPIMGNKKHANPSSSIDNSDNIDTTDKPSWDTAEHTKAEFILDLRRWLQKRDSRYPRTGRGP